jgi:hypothetical protein
MSLLNCYFPITSIPNILTEENIRSNLLHKSFKQVSFMCPQYCVFWYGVYNQCELFICVDLMIKNREIPIKR